MIKRQEIIYDSIKEDIVTGAYKVGNLLPSEEILAKKHSVSRPTISKIYNKLQREGYIIKKRGFGSQIINNNGTDLYTLGLLLPGAGESEIFNIINDQILKLSKKNKFNCYWEGATASNAEVRQLHIENYCDSYIQKRLMALFFVPWSGYLMPMRSI
jgi:DNA-binding transcriptional MocR family regulator